MRRKIALSICILFGCLYMTYGQLMNNQSFNETFRYRVKQMDEFMKRFNGMESIPLALEDSLIRQNWPSGSTVPRLLQWIRRRFLWELMGSIPQQLARRFTILSSLYSRCKLPTENFHYTWLVLAYRIFMSLHAQYLQLKKLFSLYNFKN